MTRAAAGLAVAAASLVLIGGGVRGSETGWVIALATGAAVIAVWVAGASGPGRRPLRSRSERVTSVLLGASLLGGILLAAGIGDGPGPWGLPRSLWGLLLGVWLIPLVVTSIGFAVSFRTREGEAGPQDPEASGRHAASDASDRSPEARP